MLPGIVLALYDNPGLWGLDLVQNLIWAFLATGFVASSNYVVNEILDAEKDKLHPEKRNRPIPSGLVNIKWAYLEWLFLGALGLGLAWMLNKPFFFSALSLWIMGLVYNIPPVRSKDKPYIDVISESVNNPIRLLLGWYAVGMTLIPPLSLIVAYWMLGAFFMAVKRFAEFRRIGDPVRAANYRQSFGHYNEERLLISIMAYGVTFGLCMGIFLFRYHLELLLSIPFVAGFLAWYLHLGFLPDSPTQYPEKLFKQKAFVFFSLLCAVIMVGLLFTEMPGFRALFAPTIHLQ